MAAQRTTSPTGSYSLTVPAEATEDFDQGIVSIWMPSDETLLQISSHVRESGAQVSAGERLAEHLPILDLRGLRPFEVAIDGCSDVAAAWGQDEENTRWLLVHAVWPTLSVFLTISHPQESPVAPSWAIDALRSLRRTWE